MDYANNPSRGAISTILLVLGAVLIVLIIIIFFVVIRTNALKNTVTTAISPASATPTPVPTPVYDTTVNGIRFVMESAVDLGGYLKGPTSYENVVSTGRIIKVTIGAQNKGKVDTQNYGWALGNIVDSDGRNFISIDEQASYFLPNPNLCGSILKPDFTPTPCVSFYEISKESTGMKIEVDYTDQNSGKSQKGYLDLPL